MALRRLVELACTIQKHFSDVVLPLREVADL
jgi:hypothetical protein